jgi:hypothetical protein
VEEEKIFCCEKCNKRYKSNVGLWKHNKICIVEPTPITPITPITPTPPITPITPTPVVPTPINEMEIKKYIQNNPELFIDMLKSVIPIQENQSNNIIVKETTIEEPNTLNIVNLIENNVITTTLSNTYQNKLINKINEQFNNDEQHLFIASFYCYLNCNENDFIVDLDNIWEWLGFSTKQHSKRLLENKFKREIDYKIPLTSSGKRLNDGKGGYNKEIILLTIPAFKKFCLKAETNKADQIHEYYVKMERILHETIKEECNEFKLQLQNKETLIEEQKKQLEIKEKQTIVEQEKIREKTLLEQFPLNTESIYIGLIDNTNEKKEKLVKFGFSNNLNDRIKKHKTDFNNFRLIYAYKVENMRKIENCIKNDEKLKQYRRSLEINNVNQIELLAYDKLTVIKLDEIIKKIIITNEYTAEKITNLLEEVERLKTEVNVLKKEA